MTVRSRNPAAHDVCAYSTYKYMEVIFSQLQSSFIISSITPHWKPILL